MSHLLNSKEVSQLFGVSKQTVNKWAHSGELQSVTIGGITRFRPEAIEQFIAKNEREREAVSA